MLPYQSGNTEHQANSGRVLQSKDGGQKGVPPDLQLISRPIFGQQKVGLGVREGGNPLEDQIRKVVVDGISEKITHD